MNLIKLLRNELAKKLGQTVADVAADSVDHCASEAKKAIEKTVEERTKMLLDPNNNENILSEAPNEHPVFRSDNNDKSFHIEVKGLSGAWQDIQKNNDPDKALKDNVQIKAEWTFKF